MKSLLLSLPLLVFGTASAASQGGSAVSMQRVFDTERARFTLSTSDAKKLPIDGLDLLVFPAGDASKLSTDETARAVLYSFESPSRRVSILTLVGRSTASAFTVAVYDSAGAPAIASRGPASEHRLVIPSRVASGFVEIVFENPSEPKANTSRDGGFRLAIASTTSDDEPVLAHSQQYAVADSDYGDLVRLAGCDWADPTAECQKRCDLTCREAGVRLVRDAIGMADAGRKEPIVAFVGAAGANRTVLLNDDTDQSPLSRTLRTAKYFWGAFVEDTGAPFNTSIDIHFKQWGALGEFDEFDPTGLVAVRSGDRAVRGPNRTVRIGFKRFRVRASPADVQITFSRQGPTYGIRQWVRTYRLFGSHSVWPVGSVLVPGRTLKLDEYQIDSPVGSSGQPPTASRVSLQDQAYRIFATLTITWPKAHNAAFDSDTSWGRFWKTMTAPEPQVGISIPEDPFDAIFTGLSWPLPYRPLRVSVGWTFLNHERLQAGLFDGQAVPLGTRVEDLVRKVWVRRFTAGFSVDVAGR